MTKKQKILRKWTQAGVIAAVAYVSFAFLRIEIPLPGGHTAIHLGNALCVLGGLLLGSKLGGLSGAVGLSMADVLSGTFLTSAPTTFVLKFCIGAIAGLVAHKIGKIHKTNNKVHVGKWTVIASFAALGFNVIFAPIVSYLWKLHVLGQGEDAARTLARLGSFATMFNAVICLFAAVILYQILRPILLRTGDIEIVEEVKKESE